MPSQTAASDLYRLIDAYKVTQAIHVAAVLGIADHIAAGLRTSQTIAEAAGAHPAALYRLLRALAAIGVLREDEDRRFSLAPMGETLRSDAAQPLGPFATLTGQDYYWQTWGHLLHSIKTGENAFEAVHGVGSWTYRDQHPDQDAIFNLAMTANATLVDPAIVEAVDFDGFGRLADIGGGQGSLLIAILRACPHVRAVLFDRPSVVASARSVLAAARLDARCELASGDMFESVPAGCDAYLLKFVLHDWTDDEAGRLLRVCRRAMASGARLFVVERLIGDPNSQLAAALSDLNMLVGPGGRERTAEEFAALFKAADLRLDHVVATRRDLSVIVGEPT
ncbi:MAG TPA: methyltransferase [Vicinamibacterales bacterium]